MSLYFMKVSINPNTLRKVQYWVDKADQEISGFGLVSIENGIARITDAFMTEQQNSSASTEMNPAGIGKLSAKLIRDGKITDTVKLRWWWHSHVNMNVFWSSTDWDAIKQLGDDWFISTVFNKKREYRTIFYGSKLARTPFGDTVYCLDDIKFTDDMETYPTKDWDDEFDAAIVKQVYVPPVYPNWRSTYEPSWESGTTLAMPIEKEVKIGFNTKDFRGAEFDTRVLNRVNKLKISEFDKNILIDAFTADELHYLLKHCRNNLPTIINDVKNKRPVEAILFEWGVYGHNVD